MRPNGQLVTEIVDDVDLDVLISKELLLELIEDLQDAAFDYGNLQGKYGEENAAEKYELACLKVQNALEMIEWVPIV